MTKKIIFLIALVGVIFIVKMTNEKNEENVMSNINVIPVSHASVILNWDEKIIYADPVGEASLFEGKPSPDIVLLTDIHGDHFDAETLQLVATIDTERTDTRIFAPQAVADKIPEELKEKVSVINNGEAMNQYGFKIEAIPMYNLPESEKSYHIKGRGNGYVLEKAGTRVYISGDTSGISEMRNLQDIDVAFVAMNLPYTMGVEEAADAVLQFKPKKIYPYHYRTPDGLSDVAKFKQIVNSGDPTIEVVQLEWYPK